MPKKKGYFVTWQALIPADDSVEAAKIAMDELVNAKNGIFLTITNSNTLVSRTILCGAEGAIVGVGVHGDES